MSFTAPHIPWQPSMQLEHPVPRPPMLRASFSAPTSAPESAPTSAPTSVPTSAPTSVPASVPTSARRSRSERDRRPKLRASCDACAASKVKCNKAHPICGRCTVNGLQCVYGVSRKHGKPGRTRKRNPDGTPFIKASKQRPSPDGSEFGKFRIRSEPALQRLRDLSESATSWSSNWSPTPSLPDTPELGYDLTPEPFYMDHTNLTFMGGMLLPQAPLEPEPVQPIEQEPVYSDQAVEQGSAQLEVPQSQGLDNYTCGESVTQPAYSYHGTNQDPYLMSCSNATLQSPKSATATENAFNTMNVNIPLPTSHCCYTLAYSTLDSLRIVDTDTTQMYPGIQLKSMDSVLSTTRIAVQSVLQLLSCPCSSDPHLAMLYSSITSKLLSWYQITAGVNVTSSAAPMMQSAPSSGSNSPASSCFSSPTMATPAVESQSTFNVAIQPLQFGMYQFDESEQERLRCRVVLRELKKCGQLVDALAEWKGEGHADQAEFLYGVLGTWLRTELWKTMREVEAAQAM